MVDIRALTGEEVWDSDTLSRFETSPGPVTVDHVADFYNCYPGEVVTFFTRIEVQEPIADLTLRVSLPTGLVLEDYRAPAELEGAMPATAVDNQTSYLVWSLPGEQPAGTHYEYQAQARVAPTPWDGNFESRAVVTDSTQLNLAEATVKIAVWARGRYLRHLPAIYEQDDLIARFLMLFESFLAPIESQIDHIHHYFDPRLTSTRFLPWLASWLDLELAGGRPEELDLGLAGGRPEERKRQYPEVDGSWLEEQKQQPLELVGGWSEERLRQLIRWTIALHRSRGTKWGLLKYLEIYTGQRAEIVEHRARNFVVGRAARLGPGIALGRGNQPHTFTIKLRLPPLDLADEAERARQEKIRHRTIESIIEMQKPAHTVYTLRLEALSPEAAQVDETEAETAEAETDEIEAQAAIWFKLADEPAPKIERPARKKRKSSRGKGKKS